MREPRTEPVGPAEPTPQIAAPDPDVALQRPAAQGLPRAAHDEGGDAVGSARASVRALLRGDNLAPLVMLAEELRMAVDDSTALALGSALGEILMREPEAARRVATALVLRSGIEPSLLLRNLGPQGAQVLAASLQLDQGLRSGPIAVGAEQAAQAALQSLYLEEGASSAAELAFSRHVLLSAHPGRSHLRELACLGYARCLDPNATEAQFQRMKSLLRSPGVTASFDRPAIPVSAKVALLDAINEDPALEAIVRAEGSAWTKPEVALALARCERLLPPPKLLEAEFVKRDPAGSLALALGLDDEAEQRLRARFETGAEHEPDAALTVFSALVGHEERGLLMTTVVKVEVDGVQSYVDTEGAVYPSMEAFLSTNDLPPGQFGLRHASSSGPSAVITRATPNTVDTLGERAVQAGDVALGVGGLGVGIASLCTPVGWIGVTIGGLSSAWFGTRGAITLMDRDEKGLSLSLADTKARRAWLEVAGATFAGIGTILRVGSGLGRLGAASARGAQWAEAGGFATGSIDLVDQAKSVFDQWDLLSADEQVALFSQLAFSGALTVAPLGAKVRSALELRKFAASPQGKKFVGSTLRMLSRSVLLEAPEARTLTRPQDRAALRRHMAESLRPRPGDRRAETLRRLTRSQVPAAAEAAADLSAGSLIAELASRGRHGVRPSRALDVEIAAATALGEFRAQLRSKKPPTKALGALAQTLRQLGLPKPTVDRLRRLVRDEGLRGAAEEAVLQTTLQRPSQPPDVAKIVEGLAHRAGLAPAEVAGFRARVEAGAKGIEEARRLAGWASKVGDPRTWTPAEQLRLAQVHARDYKLGRAERALQRVDTAWVSSVGPITEGMVRALDRVQDFAAYARAHPREAKVIAVAYERYLFTLPKTVTRAADAYRLASGLLPDLEPVARIGDFHLLGRTPLSDPKEVPEFSLVLNPSVEQKSALAAVGASPRRLHRRPTNDPAFRAPPLHAVSGYPRTTWDGALLVSTHGGSTGRYSGARNPVEMAEAIAEAVVQARSKGRVIDSVVVVACHQGTVMPSGDTPGEALQRALNLALDKAKVHDPVEVFTGQQPGPIGFRRDKEAFIYQDGSAVDFAPVVLSEDPTVVVKVGGRTLSAPAGLTRVVSPTAERAALSRLRELVLQGSSPAEAAVAATLGGLSALGALWLFEAGFFAPAEPEAKAREDDEGATSANARPAR